MRKKTFKPKAPPKRFIQMNGRKGRCGICNTEKYSVVNGVCFDCLNTPEKSRG